MTSKTSATKTSTRILCTVSASLIALAGLHLSAATIEWESPHDIVSADDVATEGETCFAYNKTGTDYTVNGVLFKGDTSVQYIPTNTTDVVLSVVEGAGNSWENNASAFGDGKGSTDYEYMLYGGAFYRYSGTVAMTLQSLQPGEEYLVQIWMSERRSGYDPYNDTLDGVCTITANPSNGAPGQYAVGRFRADAATQTISIYSARSPLVNAIQVRKLSGIKWGEVQRVGNGSEVSVEGAAVCAYQFSGTASLTVNGVAFAQFDINTVHDGVELASDGGTGHTLKRSNSNSLGQDAVYPLETPASYKTMLANCAYVARQAGVSTGIYWMDLKFKQLVPGHTYLVQLWYEDARTSDALGNLQRIDGVRSLYAFDADNGNLGSYVTGTFIATETSRTIRIRGDKVSNSALNNPMLNAFQLRDITKNYWCESASAGFMSGASDIKTEGTLLYAYTPDDRDQTVNGVTFSSQSSTANWGDGNVTMTGFVSRRHDTTFFPSPASDFENLLAPGIYGSARTTEATLTLSNLEADTPYLVQIIVNDSRTTAGLDTRGFKVSGIMDDYAYYQDATTAKRYGSQVSLVLWPSSATVTLKLLYTGSTADNTSPQLNALQVRKLDIAQHNIDRTLDIYTDRYIEKTTPGRLTLESCPNLRYATVTAGTLVFGANAATVLLDDLNVYSPGNVEIVAGATVAVDAETFDLSAVSTVRVPSGFKLASGNRYVLTTSGCFSGALPVLASEVGGLHLEVASLPGGGEALMLVHRGLTVVIR